MRKFAAALLTVVVASATLTGLVGRVQAAATDPAGICQGNGLALAPTLSTDRTPNGGPVQLTRDRRGKFVPIIMVHGWMSRAGHSSDPKAPKGPFDHLIDLTAIPGQSVSVARSLIGQLQNLPGTAVYSFDYENDAGHWVNNQHIGPALGTAIDCLYQATGEKVIVVVHSMGGLATRWAVTHAGARGIDRATEVSTVVTFGTPEQGSLLALLVTGGLTAAIAAGVAGAATIAPILRLLFAACLAAPEVSMSDGGPCQYLSKAVHGLSLDAFLALRYGSPQLARLKPWPKNVVVDALAGDTVMQVPGAGWFGIPWTTASVQVGDVAVAGTSAIAGATISKTISCAIQLNVVRGAGDAVALSLGYAAASQVGQQPLATFTDACYHSNLTRSIELTNEALGEIADDVSSRQPLIASDLQSAAVPPMCGYPAGRFVNGKLPGYSGDQGQPRLATVDNRPAANMLTLGDLTGDGVGDAAAVVNCNRGGVSWPDSIVFYRSGAQGPAVLGSFYMGDVVGDARDGTQKISYQADGSIRVDTLDARSYDYGCCPSGLATVVLEWNGSKIVATSIKHLPGPRDVTFSGIGATKLGMTAQQLTGLGYVASPGNYLGCVLYSAGGLPSVTLDPGKNAVVAIQPPDDSYRTNPGGLGIGSLLTSVRSVFSASAIEDHMDGSFGQGMNGLLVGGSGGWISFGSNDGQTISTISVSDHSHYGSLEAGCA